MGNISVIPVLLKQRINKFGKASIAIRVYLNRKPITYENLKHKITIQDWDEKKREVKRSVPNHALLNAKIKKRVAELEEKFLQIELLGTPLTKHKVQKITKGEDHGKDFYQFCTEQIALQYSKEDQHETRRTYTTEISKLKKFRKELSFGDVDYQFLTEYKAYMINSLGNSDNTIWKAFKFISTMINIAIKVGGYIKESPFKDFDRGHYKQGKRNYLTIEDCDKIHSLLHTNIPDQLKRVGYYYLFMCYTGLRFQDALYRFNYDQHVIDDERIIIDTQKCDVEVNLYIHQRLKVILDFIRVNPLKICNKYYNKYLKVLGTMAGITIDLTAHVGRHTFGTTLADLDIPIERAQKLLGHKDKKSTEIYYHIKNKLLDQEMMKWDQMIPVPLT